MDAWRFVQRPKIPRLGVALAALGWVAGSPSLAQAQRPGEPAVPLEALRRRGARGFEALPPQPAEIISPTHGRIGTGWALIVEPDELVEFTMTGEAEPVDPFWSPEAADGARLDWTRTFEWSLPGGSLSRSSAGLFKMRAPPGPGNYPFVLTASGSIRQDGADLLPPATKLLELTVVVKSPFAREGDGTIAGYPIGIYPNEAARNAPFIVAQHPDMYRPPSSFILVTPETAGLAVSPHFRLGDFSPPEERGKNHYIAIDPRLIEFLEAAVAALRVEFDAPLAERPLRILTAFLSPNHRERLRARGIRLVEFTRYQYGDGAALIWDADGDNKIDDLSRDGRIDDQDAAVLAQKLDAVQRKLGKFGGIGAVAAPKFPWMPETPYVDVDMRGVRQRW